MIRRILRYLGFLALVLSTLAPAMSHAATAHASDRGEIEFRVGSSNSTTVAGARVIVINHEGKVVSTGLTDTQGLFIAHVPMYKAKWNERYDAKGVVNAIVVADGYNEQAVFVVPITEHTIQPVILQPIRPNARNAPSVSLGNFSSYDLAGYIDRYASELHLKRQGPIPGEPSYSPWSAQQATASSR
ncbi:hypothetical protein [Alicyclobacillus acidocaldarius]|uniref:Carboxypeptidase regulatory-like domain-containing protein n=1 Tax=Alicyclobacillus acidocaldarius subsp. acidocaldarius (strain ATCC 27009 / DSM 446 / BCRC 14685 / JCM 5260 / KCTC 1825 / NBRC 15652 / NCIMB 11725 / NRRL B-14509 / 104-IA) TaxID=521098 RepID=C8WR89_ALIAD|nr:hypothetical protein [Alicyclobacillus acidocaldarius]ACV59258.1 hypothetical protein Aaci_2249 [Alicyclobacillus acidocaldarius subsp. acidocaldarius DSM 446]